MRYLGQRKVPKGKTPETDSYLGSGTNLLKAIKKYGKEHFSKEIIHICTTQSEADTLEIIEIEVRSILKRKDKWYNIASGGQYGRCDNHSEITSKAMKDFYNSDKGIDLKERMKQKAKVKRLELNILKHGSLLNYQLYLNLKHNKKKLKSVNSKMKKNIKKLNSLYTSKKHSVNGAKAWIDKDIQLQRIRKGQRERVKRLSVEGKEFFSKEQKEKFMLAKFKQYDNNVGIWLFSKGFINYKLIEDKMKNILTKRYNLYNNYIEQIDVILELIKSDCGLIIDKNELMYHVNIKRANKGLSKLNLT